MGSWAENLYWKSRSAVRNLRYKAWVREKKIWEKRDEDLIKQHKDWLDYWRVIPCGRTYSDYVRERNEWNDRFDRHVKNYPKYPFGPTYVSKSRMRADLEAWKAEQSMEARADATREAEFREADMLLDEARRESDPYREVQLRLEAKIKREKFGQGEFGQTEIEQERRREITEEVDRMALSKMELEKMKRDRGLRMWKEAEDEEEQRRRREEG